MAVTNQFRDMIGRLLGWAAVIFCGSFILVLGAVFSGMSVYYSIMSFDYHGWGTVLGLAIAYGIKLIVLLYFGVAFGRFLLRVAPPHLDGRMRVGSLLLVLPISAVFFLFSALFLASLIITNQKSVGDKAPLMLLLFLLAFLVWFVGLTALLLKRHLKPYSFSDQNFILFLRRFSTFSDRAVINVILRKGGKKPVVFLIPPRNFVGDWNPFLVGFVGMRLLHPFRSVPFFLKAKGDAWEQVVQTLVEKAETIILDVSQASEAIATEVRIIDAACCWEKTTLLSDVNVKAAYKLAPASTLCASKITYRKSLVRAIPRLLLGLVFTYNVWGWSVGLIVVTVSENRAAMIVGGIVAAVPCLGLYLVFFGRRSIDRASKKALKSLMQPTMTIKEAVIIFFREHRFLIRLLISLAGGLLVPIALFVTLSIVVGYLEPISQRASDILALFFLWPLALSNWFFPQPESCSSCGPTETALMTTIIFYFVSCSVLTFSVQVGVSKWVSQRRRASSEKPIHDAGARDPA